LTVGILGVVGATSAWRHFDLPAWTFPVVGIGGTAAIAAAVSTVAPSIWNRVMDQLTRLFGTRGITQTQSLFGETMGWLFLFGFLLVVSLPAIGWACTQIYTGSRRWIAPTSYGIFLMGLGAIQLRFGGELSPFIALFGGLAIVALARWIDLVRSPVPLDGSEAELSMPSRGTLARLAIVVVLICGLSAVQAPIAASGLTIPEERYETASFISDHATEAGHEYPESYVFSPWSWNRMYNYYVNGEAGGYGYAQSNYQTFVTLNNASVAHEQFVRGDSYLVTEPVPNSVDIPPDLMQVRLHNRYGSRGNGVAGLAHYRALYASPSGNYKAFRVVPGGTIEGTTESNANVTLTTEVDIEGDEFTYERRARSNANGTYSVTVPYPGEYELDGATAESVTVSEQAVNTGETVSA
jgi:dolichyl-diphosphooligosaccharide--protein glycosyltransferase